MFKRAPYATLWEETKGRDYPEPEQKERTPFSRDRDRIIHSDTFRKLQYKTQVYVNQNPSDHYRTRLTHSLEVAQICRSICRALKLDQDLGECVALAHDLGHPPFGHDGENALNDCMKAYGGYRHNDQTLKLVTQLEHRYPLFDGLNLTWESREGIAKHNGPLSENCDMSLYQGLNPFQFAGLEAQVAALSDDIAYNHHDLDDSLYLSSIPLSFAKECAPFGRMCSEVESTYPQIDEQRLIKETLRRMQNKVIVNLINTTKERLKSSGVKHVEDVRCYKETLVCFSPQIEKYMSEIRDFMYENVYKSYQSNRDSFRAHRIIHDLFNTYMEHRKMLPKLHQRYLPEDKDNLHDKAHVIANYIAGLTDRSAAQEHARLFGIR